MVVALLAVPFLPPSAEAQTAYATVDATRAQYGGFTLTLGASFGQLAGTAYERVYAPEIREFKVSELKWDLKDVAMGGVQGTLGFGSRFRLNLGYWIPLNEGSGEMVDTDWEFLNTTSEDQWTKQSRHPDTAVDSGSVLDINLDYRVYTAGSFSVSGILGYRRNEWEWSSRGGSFVYSWDLNNDGFITPDEFRVDQGSFPDGQLVITYRQQYEVPYLGLGLDGAFGPVEVQGHLLYSPWVSAEDHDVHVLRDTTFDGDFSGGSWFGLGVSARWFFLPRWYATLGVEYEKYDEIVGTVTQAGPEGRFVFDGGGSVEPETVLLLFGAGVRF
jgi:plasminogen activator